MSGIKTRVGTPISEADLALLEQVAHRLKISVDQLLEHAVHRYAEQTRLRLREDHKQAAALERYKRERRQHV